VPQSLAVNPLDVAKHLLLFLPKTVRMPNGDAIPVNWYDAEEAIDYQKYPYGTFYALPSPYVGNTHRFFGVQQYGDDEVAETYTYASGVVDYQLQAADVFSVTSLIGTVASAPHTFIQGVDFTITEATGYGTPSQVHWISGTRPDNGTAFTVTFRPRRGQSIDMVETYPTYRLTLTCSDLPAGTNGATVAYSKTQVSQFAMDWLLMAFRMAQGKGIGPRPRDLIVRGVQGSGFMPVLESESVRRAWLDLQLCRRMLPVREDFEFVGSAVIDLDDPDTIDVEGGTGFFAVGSFPVGTG